VEPAVLLDALAELARECGLAVRVLRLSETPTLVSGPALVKGKPWVVLVADEPLPARIEALASALVRFAGPELERRYLAPAVRACLERASGSSP
jgi:hypothetical protein